MRGSGFSDLGDVDVYNSLGVHPTVRFADFAEFRTAVIHASRVLHPGRLGTTAAPAGADLPSFNSLSTALQHTDATT